MSSMDRRNLILATITVGTVSITLYELWMRWMQKRTSFHEQFGIPPELLKGKYASEMKLAIKCAIEAGNNMIPFLQAKGTVLAREMDKILNIGTKNSDIDLCTAIDVQNELLITTAIQNTYPNHIVIGEESTGTGQPPPLSHLPTWIIDPIDGTTNFASGSPFTCVSIGFCDQGSPVMGVIYSPGTQEMYLAMKGLGAFRNGVRLSTSSCSDRRLSNSVVGFEFGYVRSKDGIEKMLEAVKRIMIHGCRSTRSYGSGALDLCYVASGRLDIVYTGVDKEGWKPWDYCAAMVIVEESGCTIRSLREVNDQFAIGNDSFSLYSTSMICGVNETLVRECKLVLQPN